MKDAKYKGAFDCLRKTIAHESVQNLNYNPI